MLYGSEGPTISISADARRNAATTPPSLGNMNPYGGEGPPGGQKAQVTQWWNTFQELETWEATHGFPSRTARRGDEKRLAQWWNRVKKSKDKLDEEQLAAVKRMELNSNTTPVDVPGITFL